MPRFLTLLHAGVIPIINENDTVAVEEIRMGDNDTLAANVAVKVKADLLVLLTDVEGLMTKASASWGRRTYPLTSRASPPLSNPSLTARPGSEGGTGGMMTKIRAARYATRQGSRMVIASGKKQGILSHLAAGRLIGTFFAPNRHN